MRTRKIRTFVIGALCCACVAAQSTLPFPLSAIQEENIPALRYPKLAQYNEYLFMVGGGVNRTSAGLSRDLYVVNTSPGFSWFKADLPQSDTNPLISIPSYTVLGAHIVRDSLFVFLATPTTTELHALDLKTGNWSIPQPNTSPPATTTATPAPPGVNQFLGLPTTTIPPLTSGACSLPLGSPDRAILLQGQVLGNGTSYVYLLDMSGMTWLQVSGTRSSRNGVGCVDLADGGGLVVGGAPIDGTVVSPSTNTSMERFVADTGVWSEVTGDNPPKLLADMIGVVRKTNDVYLYGGAYMNGTLSGSMFKLSGGGASEFEWNFEASNTPSCCGSSVYDPSRDIMFMVFPDGETGINHLSYSPSDRVWLADTQIQSFIPSPLPITTALSTSPSPPSEHSDPQPSPTPAPPTIPQRPSADDLEGNDLSSSSSALIAGIVIAATFGSVALATLVMLRSPKSRERAGIELRYLVERVASNMRRRGQHRRRGGGGMSDAYALPSRNGGAGAGGVRAPESTILPMGSNVFPTMRMADFGATPTFRFINFTDRIMGGGGAGESEREQWNVEAVAACKEFVPASRDKNDEIMVRVGDMVSVRESDYFDDGWCLGVNETCKIVGIFPSACIGPKKSNEPDVDKKDTEESSHSKTDSSDDDDDDDDEELGTPAVVSPNQRTDSLTQAASDRLEHVKVIYFKTVSTRLLSQQPQRSALKSRDTMDTQKTRKSVKIVSPASAQGSVSEDASVIDYYADSAENLNSPLDQTQRDSPDHEQQQEGERQTGQPGDEQNQELGNSGLMVPVRGSSRDFILPEAAVVNSLALSEMMMMNRERASEATLLNKAELEVVSIRRDSASTTGSHEPRELWGSNAAPGQRHSGGYYYAEDGTVSGEYRRAEAPARSRRESDDNRRDKDRDAANRSDNGSIRSFGSNSSALGRAVADLF